MSASFGPEPPPAPWHQLTIHVIDEMNLVITRILDLMAGAGFGEKEMFGLRLSLEEAIVNAIKHGNGGDETKAVHVRFAISEDQALAEIEDQGPGFNPDQVPDPLAPENLERPGGRGVFLMRHYMTWVRFNQRGNCVTLCKAR